MAPIVHGLESEFAGQINFVYLDIDDPANKQFLKELGFQYQPHFLFLDEQGNIIQQWLGPVKEEQFREVFSSALQ
jgi:thioredoxin-like negative regulator of GroEL